MFANRLKRILEPLQTIRRVLPILWESARLWSIVSIGLLLLEIVFGLLTLYLIKSLVDAITSFLGTDGGAVDLQAVLFRVAAFGVATLAFLVTRALSGLAREAQGMAVADHVERLIHSRAVTADLSFYESPRYFDTLQRARGSGSQRPAQVTGNILLLGKNLVMLAAVIFLLASINWILLPILFFAIVPALFVRMHFTRILYEWRRERTPLERRAGYLDWLMTSDIHAKELRLNQLGDYLRDLYSEIRSRIRSENFRISKRRTVVELIVATVATAVFFAALAYLAIQTAECRNTVGDLVLFLLIFQRAQSMGQEIVGQISRFYEDHLYVGLLFEFLDIRPKIHSPLQAAGIPKDQPLGVDLRNVSFTYPGCQDAVLHDINMEVRPGQVVALVGANGSGKTSLIKLLCRLYEPTGGEIRLAGTDIREFDVEQYRALFGVVFQDFTKYANTIRENIGFGDIKRLNEVEPVKRAARLVGADEFIEKFPHSYETMLGRLFEGGRDLSVGEWQKLALARSLMDRSKIVILDEPTSSMDPDAEYELFQDFRKRVGDRTVILISHRLSTVRLADYIYVLDLGRIAEKGTHDELISESGLYQASFTKQGENYI